MSASLQVTVGGLELRTPVVLASGCAGYGGEWNGLLDPDAVGAICLKGISLEPWAGNPPPRLAEAPAGIINAIGLENAGLEAFVRDKLPALEGCSARIIANVIGRAPEEYPQVCEVLSGADRVDALELNVSCPNVKQGGMLLGADAGPLRVLVRNCRDVTAKPLWVKLPPMGADIVPLAKAALAGGADAVTVANTLPAMAIDLAARRPVLGNVYGGLSGPAVRPIILRLVHRIFTATGAAIIASGGVDGWEAAAAYILAGARAVAVGTALFANPATPSTVTAGLSQWLEREGFDDINAAVGTLRG